MSYEDDEVTAVSRPRISQRPTVVPIPARSLWIVSSDGTYTSGPHLCVAIGFTFPCESVGGLVESHYRERMDRPGSIRSLAINYPKYPDDNQFEFAPTFFLVIPEDAGRWEDLWVPQSEAFFSEDAARTNSADRQGRQELAQPGGST